MTKNERLHEAVIADLDQKLRELIEAPSNEYLLGNFHGRLIAFALAKIISKEEFNRFHDQLEASGFVSIRLQVRLDI